MTIEQRGSAARTLAESLALDPDQPLVEWHTWTPGHYETPDPSPAPPPAPGSGEPSTIPGLLAWYCAATETGYADGQPLTLLTDHSGNGNHGTPAGTQSATWQATGGPDNGPVIRFPGPANAAAAAWFTLPNLYAGKTSGTVVGGLKSRAAAGVRNAHAWNLHNGGALGDNNGYYPFEDGTIWDPTFIANGGRNQNIVIPGGAAAWHRWLVRLDSAGNWAAYADGGLPVRTAGAVGFGVRAAPVVGRGDGQWLGDMAYMLLYDHALTVDERTALDGWLAGNPQGAPSAPPGPVPVWVPPAWTHDPARSAALSTYQVAYGRQDPTDSVGPLQASSVVLAREKLGAGALPVTGERFRLTISAAAAAALGLDDDDRPRFTGEVTDVDIDLDGRIQLVGVGRRARLGRTVIGTGGAWPAELDGARVARILDAVKAQLTDLDIGTIDDGTAQLLTRVAAPAAASNIVDQVIESTGGQLVEQRTGALDWHDAEHRRGTPAAVALSGDVHLLRPFRWSQGIGGIVNVVDVGYGEPSGVVRVTEPNSADVVTGTGPLGITLATLLADQDAAYARASDIVGRRAWPVWRLPVVAVDLVRTAGAAVGSLLALRHGDLVDVSALPAGGPYTAGDVFVEGAVETLTRTSWRLSLSVADQQLAGVAPRWIDVPADVTWDTVTPATLTWLDAATVDPATL